MTSIQIDCFLSVVKHGNIAAAAKAMFLSPQAVSRHISQLEKEFSVTLFRRTKGGMELTSHGQDFYDFSVRWKGLYNRTLKSISDNYSNLSLHFRIGVSEYIDVLSPISGSISDFAHSHTSTDIRCEQHNNHILIENILSGSLDVAIMCDAQVTPNADLEIEPVAQEDLRLYISDPHGDFPGLCMDPPDLKQAIQTLPHVNTPYGRWNTRTWEEVSRRMTTYLGVPAHSHLTVPNFRSVLACIRSIPCTVVCDARFGFIRESDHIFNVPLNVPSNICCVWSKQNENPLIREFAEHLKWYHQDRSH